jgi:hypothetical protein
VTKKRVFILATCILAATFGTCATVRFPYFFPRTSFRAKYDQVKRGMTEKDVQVIMEGPGIRHETPVMNLESGGVGMEWYCDNSGKATFHYSVSGKVVEKSYLGDSWEPDWLERVRWRFGL